MLISSRQGGADLKLQVLFLDIDNTLLDFDAGAEQSMKHCFQMFGLEYQPEMFSVFNEENHKLWRKIERRELNVADLRTVRWQTVLKRLDLEADGAAMEDEFKRCLHTSAVPVEGAVEILPYLHERYCLCAASNGPYEQQINRLKKADMLNGWAWRNRPVSFLKDALQHFRVFCRRRP